MVSIMRTDYCVYTHLRPDDSIFYVGKGVPGRPHRKAGRNSLWLSEIKNNGSYTVNIVKNNLTEQEAFDTEIRLIKKLKNAGITLTNQTRGGDGCKELIFTDEIRQKIKTARKKQTIALGSKKGKILATEIKTGITIILDGAKSITENGFNTPNVYRCVLGKRKTHHGFIFKRI